MVECTLRAQVYWTREPVLPPGESFTIIARLCDDASWDLYAVLAEQHMADGIRLPCKRRVNELVNARSGVTPATALRLAKYFGTTPDLWMNLQLRWDLYHAGVAEARVLDRITKVRVEHTVAV